MVDRKNSDVSKSDLSRYHPNDLCTLTTEQIDELVEKSLKLYYEVDNLKITKIFKKKVNALIETHMDSLNIIVDQFLMKEKHKHDGYSVESIYSGMAGVALLYNFYASKTNNKHKTREKAKEIIERCLSRIDPNSTSVTYLTGKSGIYVTATEIFRDIGDLENAKKMIEKVIGLLKLALDTKMPDELLYGRAGYLYSLLLLKKIGWEDPERDRLIRQVVTSIFNSGIRCCVKDKPKKTPIMYKWHNKKYLGAAHGLSGIIHCLLLAKNYVTKKELDDLIKPALDYLLTLRYKSGNLPSSLCSDPDYLVQWCHGAPGVSHTYALAYKIFQDEKYLQAAEQYGEVVWNRGLLTKGHGLCHGVCGNTYTFISLYQLTGKGKHLYRASRFIDWCLLSSDHPNDVPGDPGHSDYSMFQGVAGVAYTLLDIQNLVQANFPGF